jgi:hypothetical protein
VALHRHPWSQVRPGVQRLAVSLLSKKGSGGYTAGGVPVTGALPELGLLNLPPLECRRVALHRHPWSQVRPGVQRLGRFVSRGPWRRPAGDQVFSRNALAVQARNPKRPRRAPPPSLDEPALGRPGRSRALYTACTGFNCTRCAPDASPRSSHARSEERGARSEERGARSEERGAGSEERGV